MMEIKKMNDFELLVYIKSRFGNEINCDELIKQKYGNMFECPVCRGKGYTIKEYNGYPSGLPDSGWVYQAAYKNVKCDVCNGVGFTKKEMVPNMVQNGWKEK